MRHGSPPEAGKANTEASEAKPNPARLRAGRRRSLDGVASRLAAAVGCADSAVTNPSDRRPWLSPGWTAAGLEYRWRAGPLFLSQFVVLGLQMAWQGSMALPVSPLPGAIAVAASVAGLLFRVWGTGILSAATMMSMSPITDRLITGGAFGLVRNPLYLGDLLIFTSYTLLLNPWLAPWFAAYHVVRVLRLIAYEEQRLLARWGEAYARYCAAVPRLVPRLGAPGPAAVNWRDGLVGSAIWIGFVLGYVAAATSGDLWALTWWELGGFVFFFAHRLSRKIVSESPADIADTPPD
jgi:protein-S-isoprenylcysteine O-methyltransferase Ste14